MKELNYQVFTGKQAKEEVEFQFKMGEYGFLEKYADITKEKIEIKTTMIPKNKHCKNCNLYNSLGCPYRGWEWGTNKECDEYRPTEERYWAEDENGKGYIYDKEFSEKCPIAVEETFEKAFNQACKFNEEE